MKLMPALPESIFDVLYLCFAIVSGIAMIRGAAGRQNVKRMGIATLVLGCGDAFHLVPRVLDYWLPGDYTAMLGIGKLITSITMTVFYLILEYIRRDKYQSKPGAVKIVWALSAIRILLCLFPQNAWTSADAPVSWGIIRNIPFVVIGLMAVVFWFCDAKADKTFRFMYLAVLLSFAFYLPVVVLARTIPIMGMLMLPKTVMYIWMILMFRKESADTNGAENR